MIRVLVKSLQIFDKLKWVFRDQRLKSNGQQVGHFDIPRLHALTHCATWIKRMGTLDNVNTALTETLNKIVKAGFRHSNIVDLFPQMCFWDNWRTSVEMGEATLKYLALEELGPWSNKIPGPFDIPREVRPALPLLARVKPYTLLGDLEQELQLKGFLKAMISYVKKLKLQSHQAGRTMDEISFSSWLENPYYIFISQAFLVSLKFPSFQDKNQ